MFYRRLLRTMMQTFTNDYTMFHQVRMEARQKILEHKDLTDSVEIQNKIFFGEEVRDFFKTNMLQGQLQESGNVRFKAKPEHSTGKDGEYK